MKSSLVHKSLTVGVTCNHSVLHDVGWLEIVTYKIFSFTHISFLGCAFVISGAMKRACQLEHSTGC